MSQIVIASAFRNAAGHVSRYFTQMAGLYLGLVERDDSLYLLLGEGDSTDGTRDMLLAGMQQTGLAGKGIDVTHGGARFGSIVHPTRFAQLAGVYNKLWAQIPAAANVVIFLEGDLIWQPETLLALIDRLDRYAAVAPMVMHAPGCTRYGDPNGKWFYDRWGFAAGGVNFTNEPPYHDQLREVPLQLDSAGSCIAMHADAARAVRFPAADMVVGMTRLLAAQGTPVYLQPDLEIQHPNV